MLFDDHDAISRPHIDPSRDFLNGYPFDDDDCLPGSFLSNITFSR